MAEIDAKDREILFEVDKDSRRSIKDIAKILGMKRDTVAYRIKQLEEKKIINGYYALIDYSKMGYNIIRVYIKLQNTTNEIEDQIINRLVELPNTITVYRTDGDWDIAIGFLIKNLYEFDKSYTKLKEKFKKYIYLDSTSIFLEFVHYYRNYLTKKPDNKKISTGKSEKTKLDEKDLTILTILSKNSKTPLLEIAQKLEITSMAVHQRIKNLEQKKVIVGYRAFIDSTKINYEYYKIDLDLEQIEQKRLLQEFLQMHPNVIYEDVTVAGSDIEFDIEVKNHEEYYNILKEIKNKFPEAIRTYKYYRANKIYKYVYLPTVL